MNTFKRFLAVLSMAAGLSATGAESAAEKTTNELVRAVAARDVLLGNVHALEQRGIGAYSRVTLTVLDSFKPWIEADIRHGLYDRAEEQASQLARMGEREVARTEAILAGKEKDFGVPRFLTGPLERSHAQTIGTRRWPDGHTDRGPVILTGYGHFAQARKDIEKFPAYGCNIIQTEIGPWDILKDEDTVSTNAILSFLACADRAAKANVSITLLLSPHYFPNWALKKWPRLSECKGGFFHYCIHDPDARSVIEKYLRVLVPMVKDCPALHSLCLSNEPVSVDLSRCSIAAKEWRDWLNKRYGNLAALNRRWGTNFTDFAQIKIPAFGYTPTPLCLEFVRFNEETLAAFHQWMADVVHSMAPWIPVHAKIMMHSFPCKIEGGFWSVDPERFAAFSQYNGNDAVNFYRSKGAWNNQWCQNEAGYDFQRSVADLPIFNTENHLIEDREKRVIPPEHLYSALWQNAVHGQSSTTLWVWERADDSKSDLAGSILHRPECVEAFGRCALDLSRLADFLAPIQNLEPTILLHWSPSSLVMGNRFAADFFECYAAANFLGQPLGIVTERQLSNYARDGVLKRPLSSAKVILLPYVTHLPDDARAALKRLQRNGVKIVACGTVPARDDLNHKRAEDDFEKIPLPGSDADGASRKDWTMPEAAELHSLFTARREDWDLPDSGIVLDTNTGLPAFGVESRCALKDGHTFITLCNHLREPKTVKLSRSGKDLITGKPLPDTFVAEPMRSMFVELEEKANEIVLCSWNLENLFDTVDDPANTGDDGFTPKGWMRWTERRYHLKLKHLSDIIAQMKPHVLCVMEVENRTVLEDLARTLRERHDYDFPAIIHRDSTDPRGIDVAILAVKQPDHVEWIQPAKGLRDTIAATFTFDGRSFTVYANHWKSKLGKKEESDSMRRLCAEAVRKDIDQRLVLNPAAALIVTGDFNDEADSPSLTDAALFTTNLTLVADGASRRYLYNLAGTLPAGEKGTYYYAAGQKWNWIDTFIVTRGMWEKVQPSPPWRIKPGSYQIFKTPAQCTKSGMPLSFRRVRRKDTGDVYQTGYSDHFPIRVVLGK